ncbi:hypothetical protein D9M71_709460 [compost metagenome]
MVLTLLRSSSSRVWTVTVLGTLFTSCSLRVALIVTCCRFRVPALLRRSSTMLLLPSFR